jgi:CRP-like cAMP-binding protein
MRPTVAEMSQKIRLLKTSELFEGLSSSVCEDIVSNAYPRDCMCSEVMFFAGDPIKEVLLLTEGRAKLTQVSADGTEIILRLCVPCEVVAPLALVQGRTHRSTAVALQACKLLVWGAATFEATLDRYPFLLRNVQSILERRLTELQRRLYEVFTDPSKAKLANEHVTRPNSVHQSH